MVRVSVYPADGAPERPIEFGGLHEGEVTFVDNESHGQGPVGRFEDIEEGGQRLILSSPNIVAVLLDKDDGPS